MPPWRGEEVTEVGASSYAFSSLLFPSWEAAKSAATLAASASLHLPR